MEKRCFACMNRLEGDICRRCGHNNTAPGNVKESLLPPGTVLGGRYYIGIPADRNGEGVTYVGCDEAIQVRVRVREFFPGALCHREGDQKTITVNPGCEIRYKALMTDFAELSRQLIDISAGGLLRAKEIFSENGTLYVIYEDVDGMTLTRFLMQETGELTWEETESLFLPLLHTVKLLNAGGIIHRGISPDTILVTENRELKLTGICTSAVRAINTEVKAELFSGYAAPEQYEKCSSHGEWTDVYAVCAVLYKTLTGTMPERADLRCREDTLVPPIELNAGIPYNVSRAIMQGLACDRSRRTPYIKDLIGGLYTAAPVRSTPRRIIEEDDEEEDVTERMPSRNSGGRRRKKKRVRVPVWLIVILITLPMMLALFFLTYYYILGDGPARPQSSAPVSSGLPYSSEASSAPVSQPVSSGGGETVPKIVLDDFVGARYEDIVTNATYAQLYTFGEKIEKFDENAPIGDVIEQSPQAKTMVEQGAEIQLTVSKGKQYVTLPPLADNDGTPISVETYQRYLEENGLTVKIESMDDAGFPEGEIIRLSQEPGTAVNREETGTVILYVSTGHSYGVLHGDQSAGQPASSDEENLFDSLD